MVKTTKIATIIFTTTSCLIWASAIPRQESALSIRDPPELLPQAIWGAVDASPLGHWFEKRKGGGGGGGSRGSGSSSSGSSSSGSSPGDSSGSGELLYNRCNQVKLAALMRNIGSRSGTSNTGGSSAGGSGAAPRYGPGGSSYKGGATTPYRAGATSPRGVAPLLLGGAALGFLAGSALVYGAYVYSLPNSVTYLNQTANQNQTSPVNCYCEQYQECSCDQLDDSGDEDNYVNGQSPSLPQRPITEALTLTIYRSHWRRQLPNAAKQQRDKDQ